MQQWFVIMEAVVETLLIGSLITLIICGALLLRRGLPGVGETVRDTEVGGSG